MPRRPPRTPWAYARVSSSSGIAKAPRRKVPTPLAELPAIAEAIPTPQRNAAFPGALLIAAGAFLIVWALRDWGVLDKAPTATAGVTS